MHLSRGTPDPLRPQGPRYKENSMRSSRRQFLQLLGAGAAAATGIDVPSGFAQAAGPVKIGVLAIRAGIAAPVGAAGPRRTEWWAERVNKAGGIRGPRQRLVAQPRLQGVPPGRAQALHARREVRARAVSQTRRDRLTVAHRRH